MCSFEEGLCKEWIDADKSTDKNKKKYRIFVDTLNYDGHLTPLQGTLCVRTDVKAL